MEFESIVYRGFPINSCLDRDVFYSFMVGRFNLLRSYLREHDFLPLISLSTDQEIFSLDGIPLSSRFFESTNGFRNSDKAIDSCLKVCERLTYLAYINETRQQGLLWNFLRDEGLRGGKLDLFLQAHIKDYLNVIQIGSVQDKGGVLHK